MAKNSKNYKTKITLYNSYFDNNDRISPSAIFRIFQDVASKNGEDMGVGFESMLKEKLYWVITRQKYDILIEPKVYQTVVVETWPHAPGKIDFDRDFLISDEKGNVLIKGTSKWCVISSETRKLVPISKVKYLTEFDERVNYTERMLKTEVVKPEGRCKLIHKVSYNEIDHNKHVNNVNYASYVYSALRGKWLSHLQVNFISECKLHDLIKVYVQKIADGYLLSGYVNGEIKFSAYAK